MNADIKPEVVRRTQEVLGRHIKKPPLTDKLLKKPPFRFLHDIITAVIHGTGFLDGVLTAEEMHHENIKDKEGKIAFLQKVIDAVGSSTGIHLSVRPTKIVAGHEPTRTNELLQAIGNALDVRVKSKSKSLATSKSSKSQPALPQEKNKPKDTDKRKQGKTVSSQNSKLKNFSAAVTADANLHKEPEMLPTVSDLMGEIVDAGGRKDHYSSEPLEDQAIQDIEVKRPASAHLRQRQTSALKQADTNVGQKGDSTSQVIEGDEEASENVPARRPISVRPPTARPASSRPAAPRIRDRGDVPRVDEAGVVTGKVYVITDNDTILDPDDETFLTVETKQTTDMEQKVQALGEAQHGHLVAQILETQKDLEDKGSHHDSNKAVSKKVDIEWEGGRKRDRVAVSHEVEQLRSIIQKATSVVNPLGKLMDYVQEDIDAMHREYETWRDKNKHLSLQLHQEQRLTDQAIEPMKLHLSQLEESIQEKRDQLSSLKANVLHNDARIKQLLLGDVGSAH